LGRRAAAVITAIRVADVDASAPRVMSAITAMYRKLLPMAEIADARLTTMSGRFLNIQVLSKGDYSSAWLFAG
jgi:hypothetical protein